MYSSDQGRVGWWVLLAAATVAALPAAPRRLSEPARAAPPAGAEANPLAGLAPLGPEDRAVLEAALAKSAAETGRWAYTLTTTSDDAKGETVARFDPSQPEELQWSVLQIDGDVPSAREKRRWERKRVDESRDRQTLGELIDLTGARRAGEAAGPEDTTRLVVEVPLRELGNNRFPPEKFRVRLTLDRELATLTGIEVGLREAFRLVGVIKVTAAALQVDYAEVDPAYPPMAVSISGGGAGSILFMKVDGTFTARRSDFTRVKPYSDRFDVEIGELRALDF